MVTRTLRSKRLRHLLWQAAAGRCMRCGEALGEDWQADHVVPWKVSQRTNVHEMQALCADCNRKKGARYMRRFQRAIQDYARAIKAYSTGDTVLLADVVPGGGKSIIPLILAREIIPTRADALCWIVPRESLQEQAEGVFADAFFRKMFDHQLEIRQSTNDQNPCRDKIGFVTTYQAAASNPQPLIDEFSRSKRYILVLDEPHHVADGGAWHKAIAPLWERAAWRVLQSGTFERGDGKRIAFVPYCEGLGGAVVDRNSHDNRRAIRYSRTDALRERAIKPLIFRHIDGRAEWIDQEGETKRVETFTEADRHDSSAAVYTALHTEYAHQVLERAVDNWRDEQSRNPRAKLLVVAASISTAKDYLRYLRKLGVQRAEIATSDESSAAKEAIRHFKRGPGEAGALEALVTVAMAYEGLDVPSITHLACLTHIRSRPWIEQMLARVVRVDRSGPPYEEQTGYVWVPDDPLMRDILDRIQREQEAVIHDPLERPDGVGKRTDTEVRTVAPIAGAVTAERVSDQANGVVVGGPLAQALEQLARELHIPANAAGILQLIQRGQALVSGAPSLGITGDAVPAVHISLPSQREASLRGQIQRWANSRDARLSLDHGTTNKTIVEHFGKKREHMSESELKLVWQWIAAQEAISGPA